MTKEKDKKNIFNLLSNLPLLHNLKNNSAQQCGLDAACPVFTYVFYISYIYIYIYIDIFLMPH